MHRHPIIRNGILISIIFILLAAPVIARPATRAWLEKDILYVEFSGRKQMVDLEVYEAVIAPDGELVLYTKRTGGGIDDEGRTMFLYNPALRLREPLFQFTDVIKSPVWVRRDERDFILYTRGRGNDVTSDTVALFDLGPRRTLLTFPGSIIDALPGGGVSYQTYADDGTRDAQFEFFVDEFVEHPTPPEGSFATASSQLETTVSDYSPSRMFDGNWRTCWIEGIEGDGINEWIQIDFPEKIIIRKIYVITGFHKTHEDFADLFKLNSRLKRAIIETDGGGKFEANFLDTKEPQLIDLGDGVETSMFRLTIRGAYSGSEWDDLCISEIMFETG